MNILSLDVGEYCGWAILIYGQIESGTEHLKHKGAESRGFKYLRFTELINRLYRIGAFNLIVYEKPHGLRGHAIEAMNGYITRIHEFAVVKGLELSISNQIEYKGYSPSTIKKFATGNGRASKEDMIAYFKEQTGNDPVDDKEADSYSLLRYAMQERGIPCRDMVHLTKRGMK